MIKTTKFSSVVAIAILGVFAIAGCALPGAGGNTLGGIGPAAVDLKTAGNYVILAETAVTASGVTAITGDIGISPNTTTSMTGFSLIGNPTTDAYLTSALVTGKIYGPNCQPPTPASLTTAIGDMGTAYTDAAGRTPAVGANLNMGAGTISGVTLAPGIYTWGTDLNITTDITLSGGANDTWILQIAGFLSLANAASIHLSGGALAKNVVWQVAGTGVTLGTTSHFEGTILALKAITFNTGATMNGRALAQTAVSLSAATLAKP